MARKSKIEGERERYYNGLDHPDADYIRQDVGDAFKALEYALDKAQILSQPVIIDKNPKGSVQISIEIWGTQFNSPIKVSLTEDKRYRNPPHGLIHKKHSREEVLNILISKAASQGIGVLNDFISHLENLKKERGWDFNPNAPVKPFKL